MTYLTPRNTLVLVRLVRKTEEKVGLLTVPSGNDEICEAEILAVGPGTVAAEGGVPETHDLEAGQRVLASYQVIQRSPTGVGTRKAPKGLKLKPSITDGENDIILLEQTDIIAILPQTQTQPLTLTKETD